MSDQPLQVAVVGHTNTGKTSLMRTMTRDVDFGEVSDHPAVTRHVEGTALLLNGHVVIELYDTPGMEDSIGLLEELEVLGERRRGDIRVDWIDLLQEFLESEPARGRFQQEAKALRRVLQSELALYVVDSRDRVLGKHRDELDILSRTATPIVPVLNFTASDQSRTEEWRKHLSRVNLHAVAEFDTVIFEEQGERRLFEKMQTLLDRRRDLFDSLIEDRRQSRARLMRASSRLVANLLLDVASHVTAVTKSERKQTEEVIEQMKQRVRDAEQRCLQQLLELFQFRPNDGRLEDIPIDDGRWGVDLFSPTALKQFGARAGGAAAAGAAAGLAIDAMTAGISMGAFTITGAALGTLWQASRAYGKRLVDLARGWTELRCDDGTLRLLLARQLTLISALLRRGHAAMEPIRIGIHAGQSWARQKIPPELTEARANPRWSRLSVDESGNGSDSGRSSAETELTERILKLLLEPPPAK